jgi:UDP-N-acetylmuramoyl-tripeptide--D-alanyl-D-alanine ligase
LQGEPRPAWAVLNADDAHLRYWKSLVHDVRVITFGLGAGADVRAEDVKLTESGSAFRLVTPAGALPVELPLAGRHNVGHACAAAAVACALGVPGATIRQGLAAAKPVAGRLQAVQGPGGANVFDDSYNANPASVAAAAEFLAARRGSGWLVLGDMGELGDDRLALHRATGEAVKKAGIARLFASGPLSRETVAGFGAEGRWFESLEALVDELGRALRNRGESGDVNILVKGSRATRMERVVQALAAQGTRERKA